MSSIVEVGSDYQRALMIRNETDRRVLKIWLDRALYYGEGTSQTAKLYLAIFHLASQSSPLEIFNLDDKIGANTSSQSPTWVDILKKRTGVLSQLHESASELKAATTRTLLPTDLSKPLQLDLLHEIMVELITQTGTRDQHSTTTIAEPHISQVLNHVLYSNHYLAYWNFVKQIAIKNINPMQTGKDKKGNKKAKTMSRIGSTALNQIWQVLPSVRTAYDNLVILKRSLPLANKPAVRQIIQELIDELENPLNELGIDGFLPRHPLNPELELQVLEDEVDRIDRAQLAIQEMINKLPLPESFAVTQSPAWTKNYTGFYETSKNHLEFLQTYGKALYLENTGVVNIPRMLGRNL